MTDKPPKLLFYTDEHLDEKTDLLPDDRLIYAGGRFAVLRNEQHLYTKEDGVAVTVFKVPKQPHPVHAALDLVEMYGVAAHLVSPGEKLHGGDREWKIAERPNIKKRD